MDWISLTAEGVDVRRDEQGVPVEWTLLRIGDNPICQEGADGNICISPEQMNAIVEYFEKKGEEIPIDSEHYLYELANKNKVDESEALKMFPGGVAALGYGQLKLVGNALRIRVKWTPTAYKGAGKRSAPGHLGRHDQHPRDQQSGCPRGIRKQTARNGRKG